MKEDDSDRILSREPEIIPSPGFVDTVMDSVRRQALVLPEAEVEVGQVDEAQKPRVEGRG